MTALAGLKVLDLTRVLAGPLCTMTLGDMGAEIIKVEPPSGDETRGWGPPHLGGEAAYYLGVNRNKRSMVLDLALPEGREVLAALIRSCDILVENYKAGTLEKWGLGDEWLRRETPGVIRCSITGYGLQGPKSSLPGYDFIMQAESGLMSITGGVEGEATKHGVAIVDIATGLYATIAILGALNARAQSGRGQTVSVSLYQTGLSLLANVASNALASGKAPGRYGNGHPNIVPYRTYATRDGALALAVGNDSQFRRFCKVAGDKPWAADPRFATNTARVANRAAIDALVTGALGEQDTAWWIEHLRAEGVPCGAVNDVGTALCDPQTEALGMVTAVEHPTAGLVRMLAPAFAMSNTAATVRLPPPLFGEHTREILAEHGFDPDRFVSSNAPNAR